MSHRATSGKYGFASYSILENDESVSAHVTLGNEKREKTLRNWKQAEDWVNEVLVEIADYEIGRDF